MKIKVLDTTLRDGAQSKAVSFSISDKVKIVRLLDELGVDLIEAGNPFSNVKDREFFREIAEVKLKNASLVAFGSTRRVGLKAEDDEALAALLNAGTDYISVFGKAWDLHVSEVLHTTLEENLSMIRDTISYAVSRGKKVIFDAEHFFDGYKRNPEYAIEVIRTADQAGAEVVCLCDTNGGTFPDEIFDMTKAAVASVGCEVGIHTHNDSGMAVGGAVMSVAAGAVHVQGTLNGIGERCGNANLCTIIANLQLKRGYEIIAPEQMERLTPICREVAEITNISIGGMPYISKGAFSHKGGMHIDAVMKLPQTFEHIDPAVVGNERMLLVSEVAGKSALMPLLRKIDPSIDRNSPKIKEILARMKELEFDGYQFEAAEASLELEIRRILGYDRQLFDIERFRIMLEQDTVASDPMTGYSTAFTKVRVGDEHEITAAESGDGPVNAIDMALRRALERFYPSIGRLRLVDYKVRVLNSAAATGAKVRVLVESTDGVDSWTTIGVSSDVIMASKKALEDSIEYKLIKDRSKTY
ncbi:MAG: citramalate synthase [Oscillospiraceae bacterium]|nr:citramalate synthase [Oscillospiraceae bacterium]